MRARSGIAVLVATAGGLISGCVFRFTNAERSPDALYRRIYIPAATDVGARGGHSARVSQAVRRSLALDTRFQLVALSQARVAVDLQLADLTRYTAKVQECTVGSEVLASGSVPCGSLNFALPDVSAEQENAKLDLRLRIVDLNNGRLLVNRRLPAVASGIYDIVGDSAAQQGLARTRELHALRYAENVDASLDRIGQVVAAEVVAALLTLDSYATTTPAPSPAPLPPTERPPP